MRRVGVGETGLLTTEVSAVHPFDSCTDAESTEAKLLHDVFAPGNVWINSGDLVREQGLRHIAFVDRVGDTRDATGCRAARACDAALSAHHGGTGNHQHLQVAQSRVQAAGRRSGDRARPASRPARPPPGL